MIWAKKVRDLGQKRNNLGHRFGPKNTKFRAKNVYLPLTSTNSSTQGPFYLVVLQLIIASKLSELEQFENRAPNGLFPFKIEFSGKWLRSRAKCKEGDPL